MSKTPITLALAGSGTITFEHAQELLDDHLGMVKGELDRDVTVIIPVTKGTDTDTEGVLADYLDENDFEYVAVSDGTATRNQKSILKSAEEVDETKDIPNGVISRLVAAKQAGDDVVLILAWGGEDETPSELCEQLLADAEDNDIEVLDLTAGLDELVFKDDTEEEPAPPPEPVKAAKAPRKSRAKAAATKEAEPKPVVVNPIPEETENRVITVEWEGDKKAPAEPETTAAFLRRARKAMGRAQVVYRSLEVLSGSARYAEDSAELLELLRVFDAMEAKLIDTAPEAEPATAAPEPEAKATRRRGAPKAADEPVKTTRRRTTRDDDEDDAPARRGAPRQSVKEETEEMVKVVEKADGSYARLGRGRPPQVGAERNGGVVVEIPKSHFEEIDWS